MTFASNNILYALSLWSVQASLEQHHPHPSPRHRYFSIIWALTSTTSRLNPPVSHSIQGSLAFQHASMFVVQGKQGTCSSVPPIKPNANTHSFEQNVTDR